MLDLLIRDGMVLDGTGAPSHAADVGVAGGRIVALGRLVGPAAHRVIRGEGRLVGPGFIDMHSHDDFNLPVNPLAPEKTRQGVTTLVTGNCGLSPAPVVPETRRALLEAVDTVDSGLAYDWRRFGEFLDRLPPLGPNVAPLVGHGTIRCAVLGDESRPPDAEELDRMRRLVAEAMEAGAFGLSTGLFGPPSGYATTDEVVELAAVAAHHGGGYYTHMRDEGTRILEAVEEALEIGRRAGTQVQISRLKISSPDHWGRAGAVLSRLHDARNQGIRVTSDQYPYTASSGGLRHHLPVWVHEGGKGRPGAPDPGRPHPRHFGTFPRVLGTYARAEGVLGLPEAVRRMTSLPADVLGLADRGRIRLGAVADLVVFDPDRVADQATFEAPDRPPVGIDAVVVAGEPVVLGGEPTGAAPGRVLRRVAGTPGARRTRP